MQVCGQGLLSGVRLPLQDHEEIDALCGNCLLVIVISVPTKSNDVMELSDCSVISFFQMLWQRVFQSELKTMDLNSNAGIYKLA